MRITQTVTKIAFVAALSLAGAAMAAEENSNPYAFAPDTQAPPRNQTGTTGTSNNALNAPTNVVTQAAPGRTQGIEPPQTMPAMYCDKSGCKKVMVPTNPR